MNKLCFRLKNSLLVNISFFNGIATFVRIIVGIISTKVVAVMLGPSGVALLGNFNNLFSILTAFSGGGINSGVTKYVAEYKDSENVRKVISISFFVTCITSILTSIVILIFSKIFSLQVFYDSAFYWLFIVLAFSLPCITFKTLFTSIFNGYKEFYKIIITNIIFSFITILITVLLVWQYSLIGAVLAIIISSLITSFIIFYLVYRAEWYSKVRNDLCFDKDILFKLFKYSLMSFVSLFFMTFIQLLLRKYIIENISIDSAGYWQAITGLTELIISMFTMTLSLYFLPRFSEITDNKELKTEIRKALTFVSVPLLVGLVVVYLLRNFLIITFFSEQFMPMKELFLFQLIGSFFKVISWVLGYILIAKAITKVFIFTEIIFGTTYYFLFILLCSRFGIVGATYAFSLNYIMLFMFLYIYFKKRLV